MRGLSNRESLSLRTHPSFWKFTDTVFWTVMWWHKSATKDEMMWYNELCMMSSFTIWCTSVAVRGEWAQRERESIRNILPPNDLSHQLPHLHRQHVTIFDHFNFFGFYHKITYLFNHLRTFEWANFKSACYSQRFTQNRDRDNIMQLWTFHYSRFSVYIVVLACMAPI